MDRTTAALLLLSGLIVVATVGCGGEADRAPSLTPPSGGSTSRAEADSPEIVRLNELWGSLGASLDHRPPRGLLLTYDAEVTTADGRIKDELAALISQIPEIEQAYIGCAPFSDAGLAQLSEIMPNLKTVSLSARDFSGRDRQAWRVSDDGLKHLVALRALQRLDLVDMEIDGSGLVHIQRLPIHFLRLEGCHQLTDQSLSHLAALNRLSALTFSRCAKLSGSNYHPLATLDNLTVLEFIDTKIDDAGLASMRKQHNRLTQLTIENSGDLEGEWATITDNGLAEIAHMPSLGQLSLLSCERVTDAGMKHVGGLIGLKHLNLSGCASVGSDGVRHLERLEFLEALYLTGTNVDDAALPTIGGLGRLTSLHLGHTLVSDHGIGHLASCKRLESVDSSGSNVTEQGRQRLRSALPQASVR